MADLNALLMAWDGVVDNVVIPWPHGVYNKMLEIIVCFKMF